MKPITQDIIRIDYETLDVTVQGTHGKYIVKPSPEMEYHIEKKSVIPGDYAKVIKSPVSGEWVMIDFVINTTLYSDYDCVENGDEPDYAVSLEDWY